ncbi:PIN-like domain-containing protein [Bacillus toyonensis]|uniref:PIN-like domain-containing protein n=1 Tax=Bacillus toyonensis TaxID=155322 RepID=UPI002E1A4F4D|nr:PIN-like domain-containing protein [Bacillus toyonensis]
MSKQWYPKITDIIGDSLIVFDTSALLNVYRYSLVSSKRILDYIKKYEEKIWIPAQVRKEFIKNKDKVRSINLYKNLDKKLSRHVEEKRDELLVQLSEYEKKRFSKFSKLKIQLEGKFAEMDKIVKEYKNEISEETGVYKEFLEEVDTFLDSLIESARVGNEMNLVDLLEVLKEGELRYKYNLPPGFEDAKTKEGIDKFGDLIMWKEIIKKTEEISEKNVIFVTSDTKSDWFHKNNQNEVENPRKELMSEFKHYHSEKEVIIIPFENYIEEISNPSDSSDKDLLLELRMNNLVKRLPQESFYKIVNEKLSLINVDELYKKVLQNSNGKEKPFVQNMVEISAPSVENVIFNANGIDVQADDIVYSIKVIAECEFPTLSYNSGIMSYGSIQTEIIVSIELKRKLEDNEVAFIKQFKESPDSVVVKVTHFITDKEKYIWENDFLYEENEDIMSEVENYSTCGKCGKGINHLNDAGNGYCIHCPE